MDARLFAVTTGGSSKRPRQRISNLWRERKLATQEKQKAERAITSPQNIEGQNATQQTIERPRVNEGSAGPVRAESVFDSESSHPPRAPIEAGFLELEGEAWLEMSFERLGHEQDHLQPVDHTEAKPPLNDIIASTEAESASMDVTPEVEDEKALDPENSEREFHRHPHTGLQREIWRPGDGDGDQRTEYFERGHVPLAQRWRIFQSNIGEIRYRNEHDQNIPPRFVFLDDRAAFEVSQSDIPKQKIQHWWPHDFGSPCQIRKNRPHIGRPAIKDATAEGDTRFESVKLKGKPGIYYFTGQKDYEPIVYKIKQKPKPTGEDLSRKRKAEEALEMEDESEDFNPRGHGHNQYTPRDMMVKHGAPSWSKKEPKVHNLPALPRASSVMKSTKSPFYIEKRLYSHEVVPKDRTEAAGAHPSLDSPLSTALHGRKPVASLASRARQQFRDLTMAEDDDDFPTRRPGPEDGAKQNTPSIGPVDVPRQMGYIERRGVIQKVASQLINTIRSQEDVQRLANELAEEKVKFGQQAKDIKKLKQQLEASIAEADKLKLRDDESTLTLAKLQALVSDKEQEMESLRNEVLHEKREKVHFEWQAEARDERIKYLEEQQEVLRGQGQDD